MNECLRPASLSDLCEHAGESAWLKDQFRLSPTMAYRPLQALYDAEWQQRGYVRGPG